jgi:acyl transferase domain-containing protein/NADP-dependent 3-hydroxy acid dehydrogenase YdfG
MSRAIDSNASSEPIAIIGLAALMPKAASLAEFWANITNGTDCIEDVPASRWSSEVYFSDDPAAPDKTYCRRGGFLPDISFDPLEFGLPPNVLAVTDTSQLLSLAVAKAALADAGYPVLSGFDHARTAAILGVAGTTMKLLGGLAARLDSPNWRQALAAAGVEGEVAERVIANIRGAYPEWNEDAFPGFLASLVPGRIANRFDLGAASYAVDAACASSLCAIRLACVELASGACDLALTGGVDTDNSIVSFLSFSKTPALSRAEQVKPFDTNCDGTLIAEGVGMLVLKRLGDAVAAGDRIYAVIRGMGASTDGRGNAIYVPRADGQVLAIQAALDQAGVAPETIGLIEAHGTGTPVGDEVELDGLMQTYGARSKAAPPAALGSVKSQIGHAKAAAGAAGMIKAALALHRRVLPPTLGVTTPHREIARDDSPFTLTRVARPWFSPTGAPRRAAVSAFGFGGANYHAVLEEFPTTAGAEAAIVPGAQEFGDGRVPVAGRHTDLVAVFSGQGSQYVGMGSALAIDGEAFRSAVELMDGALIDAGEAPCSAAMFPLWARTAAEAERQRAQLQRSLYAQAGVGAFSMGAFRLLREAGLEPACAIGHSFGELTALWSAGCFSDADFARLVVARGRSLSPPPGVDAGGLLAIRAPYDRVETVIRDNPRLSVANLNAPAQTVVGGPTDAVDAAERWCAAAGIEAIRLQVAAAFHTGCIEYARAPWRAALSALRPASPRHRVIANATAERYPDGPSAIVDLLAEQPFRPVRFRDQVEAAYREGGRIFLEIGPKALVAGLVDEVLAGRPHQTIAINPRTAGSASDQLADAIERLRAAGISLSPSPHWPGSAVRDEVAADASPVRRTAIRLSASGVVREAAGAPPSPARKQGAVLADSNAPPSEPAMPLVVAPSPRAPLPSVPAVQPSPGQTVLQHMRHMQNLLADAHGLFLSGQAAIAKALLAPGAINDPAAVALLREVQDSGAALHERYLQDQADIARGLLGGAVAPGAVRVEPAIADPPPVASAPIARRSEAPAAAAAAAPAPAASAGDTLQRLREAVAAATGYPLDFIAPAMDLEADLGIDSVKRMEILAGFRSDDLQVSARELGRARTLEEIASLLGATAEATALPASPPAQAEPMRLAADGSAGPIPDIDTLLGRIVSERTGYPADILLPTMSLESDLGIDSIKRAEIVAAAAAECRIDASRYAKAARGGTTLADLAAFLRAALQAVPIDPQPRSAEPPIRSAVLRAIDDGALERISFDRGVVVVGGDRAAADAVVGVLRGRGTAASAIIADDADESEIIRMLDAVARETGRIGAAILLPPHRTPPAGQPFRQTNTFIRWLRTIAPRLQGDGTTGNSARLLAATRLDGQLGLSGVAQAACEESGIRAAIKTARREWPHLQLQSIDIAHDLKATQAAAVLADGLVSAGFGADDFAVTAHGRHRLAFEPAPDEARRRSGLARDAVVLFSGGGRGIGALCATSLARETGARLLILGRTPFSPADPDWAMKADGRELRAKATGHLRNAGIEPTLRDIEHSCRSVEAGRELRETLARIRQHAADADYLCVDVAEPAKLAAALADATARHGPITAIVHAAGVLADRRIEDVRAGDVERVFQPKVAGLANLIAAIDPARLTRIALFSSTAGSFGNEGQAIYAMANEVLNAQAFALARQIPTARVVAIDWGPWRAGMVNDEIASRFEKKGVGMLSPEAGCTAFLDLFLNDQRGAFQFVVGDLPPGSIRPMELEGPGNAAFREIA